MSGFESFVGVNPWTALFTFCNMMITFLVLKKLLFKPVKKMIDDRQQEIDTMYADADAAKEQALALEKEYQDRLLNVQQERDQIIRDAVARAQKSEQEIMAAAQSDAERLRENARADIVQERKKALNEIKDDISGIAIDIASKITEQEIDEKKHQQLIEDFIQNMGDAS